MKLTPLQLDIQLEANSDIVITEWLDIKSDKLKELDDNLPLTKKWLSMGLENNFLFLDALGRVWGGGKDGKHFYPYHIESFGKRYGIRVATKAVN